MQKIKIDFNNPGLPQHISAVENDSQSRFFQATLCENGKAYTAPAGASYSIMYRGFGPQNQGWYDTIKDGAGKRAACAVSGNVVTCEIARQALQVPGHVSIVLCVTTGKGYMLKSWPIECDCKNDRYDSTVEIQSFFYITQVSNADWNRAIQAWENLKDAIDPTLSISGKAADAAKAGEAINAEAERAKGVESQIKGDLIQQSSIEWTVGSINSTTGKEIPATNRLRSGYIDLRNIISITFDTIKMMAFCYTDDTHIGTAYEKYQDRVVNADDIRTKCPTATRIRLVAMKKDQTDIDIVDGESTRINEYKSNEIVYQLIDKNKDEITAEVENAKSMTLMQKALNWEFGSINSTTGLETDSTTRIRCDYIDFDEIASINPENNARINIFAFDKRKNLIGFTDWLNKNETKTIDEINTAYPGVQFLRLLVMTTDLNFGTNVKVFVLTSVDRMNDFKSNTLAKIDETSRFDDKFQIIAYSTVGVAPINTEEHFLYCVKNGFDGLKCDVRITSDNKLILCHDVGFTFNDAGRITTFNPEKCTLIRDMTYKDVIALEYETEYNGKYCHPIGLDTFMTICKRYGKIPYITIRGAADSAEDGNLAPTVSKLVVDAVKNFNVVRNCIINSFDNTILMMIRAIEPEIYLSQVFTPYNAMLRTNALNNAKANDLYMLCLFYADGTHTYTSMVENTEIMEFIAKCKKNNIRIYGAQTIDEDELNNIIMLGFSGTQYKKPLTN